jgi:hypothetical protein
MQRHAYNGSSHKQMNPKMNYDRREILVLYADTFSPFAKLDSKFSDTGFGDCFYRLHGLRNPGRLRMG